MLRSGASAGTNALFEGLPLHRVAGEGERCSEVFARYVMLSGTQLKLAKRRVVERVPTEAIGVGDGANLFEPALWTFALCDGDGAVESYDW